MVLSIESTRIKTLLLALSIVVAFNVIVGGVLFVAVNASLVATDRICNHSPVENITLAYSIKSFENDLKLTQVERRSISPGKDAKTSRALSSHI
jgi:hypothetical protein